MLAALIMPAQAMAQNQAVSPVTVAPQSLVPDRPESTVQISIPEAGRITPPAGAEKLSVTLAAVNAEGSFAEVAATVQPILESIQGRQVSLSEIYAAASAIEAAHARAGYVLARVSVPPQKLVNGGTLNIVVTDGFIEAIDASQLSGRVRNVVRSRTRALVGRTHVRLQDIEQALLIAGDAPGLELRSTLTRGEKAGGTRLVLEGRQKLVSARLSIENSLAPSLGRWATTAQVALNSPFGLGEQIYGFVSGDYRFRNWLEDNPRDRVLGGGVLLPLGDGRLSLNGEATFARTSPDPVAGMPRSSGSFRRLSARANMILTQNRQRQSALTFAVEQIEESNRLPSFGVRLHQDRYMAARFGAAWSDSSSSSARYGFTAQISRGLGGLGSISVAEAAARGVPFSRMKATTQFTKLVLSGQIAVALDVDTAFSLRARAQTSFAKPLFRAEQFATEGPDGLSAYVGGRTAVDEGGVIRAELTRRFKLELTGKGSSADISPYAFVSGGAGRINAPTALERRNVSAANLGAGLRTELGRGLRLSAEYARGLSSYRPLDDANRVNIGLAISF